MNDPSKIANLTELVLERVKARVTVPFTEEIIDRVEIRRTADFLASDMWGAMLQLLIPAKKTVEKYEADSERVPVSWWDHLKQRLGWKHKTRKIVTMVEETHYHQCPHITLGFRDSHERDRHIQWLSYAGDPHRLSHDLRSHVDRQVGDD